MDEDVLHILSYNDIDREAWGRLVRESETGTWFQSSEAYAFFATQQAVMSPFAVAVADEGMRLRGVCVGYVTREPNALRQYFTCRAIINGGPALADDADTAEAEALMRAVRSTLQGGPIYIETRNFNDYSHWRPAFEAAGFAYRPHLNFHIDCTDRAAMEARMSDMRRRQVKKAVKSGVVIAEAGSEADMRAFYSILRELYARKVKTPLFPESFFLDFYRQRRGTCLLVKHEGRILGGILCPILDGRCLYEWFICGDESGKALNPSVMATLAAMDYAAEHGLKRFDVMGAGEPGVPYGVRDFKAEFGGALVEHGRWLCVEKPMLYKIGCIGVKWLKNR